MRIIAGSLKGMRLSPPTGNKVRPTTDKVKESIFNIIMGYVENAVVVDLFAGTGNLGLEAISRGAAKCYFGDRSKESMALVKKNIASCKVQDKSVTILGDYTFVLNKIPEKADVIFLDPPYAVGAIEECLQAISQSGILSEEGIVVTEHNSKEPLPQRVGSLYKEKERRYGSVGITVYGLDSEEDL